MIAVSFGGWFAENIWLDNHDIPIYSPPRPIHPRGALARRRDVGWDRCSSAGTQARSRGSAEEHAVHTDGRASLVTERATWPLPRRHRPQRSDQKNTVRGADGPVKNHRARRAPRSPSTFLSR